MLEKKADDEILLEYVREKYPLIENSVDFRFYILKIRLRELARCIVEGFKIKEAADYLFEAEAEDEEADC